MTKLREDGIITQVHYIPIHLHPYYQKLGYDKNLYPNSQVYLTDLYYFGLRWEEDFSIEFKDNDFESEILEITN